MIAMFLILFVIFPGGGAKQASTSAYSRLGGNGGESEDILPPPAPNDKAVRRGEGVCTATRATLGCRGDSGAAGGVS